MTSFAPETITPMIMTPTDLSALSLWPDPRLIALLRGEIKLRASQQREALFPSVRQQLLRVLSALYDVDAQALQLIDGARACLGNVDISVYRNAIQRLDKPDRTAEEDTAFVHYQQQIGNVLMQALDAARWLVEALDKALHALETVAVDDNRVLIFELEARLTDPSGEADALLLKMLEELKGPGPVLDARRRYVHEIGKLVFAMGHFFDSVMADSPQVIQRAEDFQRHAGRLLAELQRLRADWES